MEYGICLLLFFKPWFWEIDEIFSAGHLLQSEVHHFQEKQILAGLRENYMLNSGIFSLQRPAKTERQYFKISLALFLRDIFCSFLSALSNLAKLFCFWKSAEFIYSTHISQVIGRCLKQRKNKVGGERKAERRGRRSWNAVGGRLGKLMWDQADFEECTGNGAVDPACQTGIN